MQLQKLFLKDVNSFYLVLASTLMRIRIRNLFIKFPRVLREKAWQGSSFSVQQIFLFQYNLIWQSNSQKVVTNPWDLGF